MKLITLTKGKLATVDDEDYNFILSSGPWQYWQHHSGKGYAGHAIYLGGGSKHLKTGTILMHRLILEHHGFNLGKNPVDHINRDKLDNRLSNLRVATPELNAQNRGISRANTSGFVGVVKHGKRWIAQVTRNKIHYFLGVFDDPKQASLVFNLFIKNKE